MAKGLILVDTSILIDYFRKSDKQHSALVELLDQGFSFCISSITEFEIYSGSNDQQLQFWEALLNQIEVLPFDGPAARMAVEIQSDLKRRKKQIAIPDLFIAAIAKSNNLSVSTLNRKHFERIEGLTLV